MNLDQPVIASIRQPELSTAALRDALLRDPQAAYALARINRRRPPVAAVGQALLAWTGRVGTTFGRRAGEQHFLRLIPYLRSDRITDVVVVGADALGVIGLSLLFDAVHAAGARAWLLLDPATPSALVEWVDTYIPQGLTRWDLVEAYWADRTDVDDPAGGCPAVADPSWLHADPLGWPDTDGCLVHDHPFGCVREAVRRAVARTELTVADARAAVGRLITGTDPEARRRADDLLGVDVYRPAADALLQLSRATALQPWLSGVAPDGTTITTEVGVINVSDAVAQRALARQRAHTLLAGGAPNGPVLTIFGEGGYTRAS